MDRRKFISSSSTLAAAAMDAPSILVAPTGSPAELFEASVKETSNEWTITCRMPEVTLEKLRIFYRIKQ